MKRLGGSRDGANAHRRAFGTFDAALAASGLELDAGQRAKALEVVDAVSQLEGRPPDADGFTVQASGGEVRVVWGIGKIVVHAGFIDCRYQLAGFGPMKDNRWHELPFAKRAAGRAGGRSTPAATWLCGCGISQGPGVDLCDMCGIERPA